ncbi:MAG: hypothetical protein R2879_21520 [Saprospiraceae bacterium]
MEIHFKIIGTTLICLALVHAIFPRHFNWKEELKPLSLINRQMMTIHTFFIALVVFLMGILCIYETQDLIHTPLGKTVSTGLGIFWLSRLIVQFFGYSSDLWKGKRFETGVHILFSLSWSYFAFVFLWNGLV